MTSIQIRFLRFVEVATICILGALCAPRYSSADAIYMEGEEYWGRILQLTNDGIRFQVDCSGKILELQWNKVRVQFSRGCRPLELNAWGNPPPDCKQIKLKRPFRVFEFGNPDQEDYTAKLDYDDKSGILNIEGMTTGYSAADARALRLSFWMVCDVSK